MYTYVIIDDEELIRKGTIKKLAPIADRITCVGEAANGARGIELVKELHPDFVILDMQMPEMDGMALLPYLSENYPSMPLIVISGYRDFDYIKQAISAKAIEYLLKPFSREMIQNCVDEVIKRLENRTLLENQILTSEKEKEQACYDYDIQLLNSLILDYHVSSARMTSQKLQRVNDSHDLMLLTLHFSRSSPDALVEEWLGEQGFGDLALYLSGSTSPDLGFIILFTAPQSVIPNEKLAAQILDSFIPWMEDQETSVCAGISRTHHDLSELGKAYRETTLALDQQPVGKSSPCWFAYAGEEEPRPITWDKTEEFLFRIDAGMEEEARDLTRELFAWYADLPDCTLADVKYHCYQLSDQCRLILNRYLKNQTAVEGSNSMQNVVNHIFTLRDLEEYYLQFFANLAAMIRPQSVYAVDDIIEKIQIYMQRNYQKDLTQEFISSLFCINRSYLSTLFKSRTGEKFVDYLNNIRILRSQELLAHTDRKMYQIARAVGYDNVKYFFRVFKKSTGITPEQFRQRHMGD